MIFLETLETELGFWDMTYNYDYQDYIWTCRLDMSDVYNYALLLF